MEESSVYHEPYASDRGARYVQSGPMPNHWYPEQARRLFRVRTAVIAMAAYACYY